MRNIIEIDDTTYTVPQTWNDLTLQQQLHAYRIVMLNLPKSVVQAEEEIHIKRIELTKYLLGIDQEYLDAWKQDCIDEDPEQGRLQFNYNLRELVNTMTAFAYKEEREGDEQPYPRAYSLNLTLTSCPWPYLHTPTGDTLFGPSDGLDNATIYELGMVFMLFERYLLDNDINIADTLLATLYRPGKPDTEANRLAGFHNDRRLPILDHENTVQERAAYFRQLPHLSKQLLLFWVASCRQAIVDQFPNIFRVQSTNVERTGNDYAWAGVLLELAGGLPNLKAVQQENWYNALTYLSILEDRRKEQERQAAKRKARARR